VIVAGIVFPAQRRVVGELLRLDEVLQPQFRRVHAELLRQDVHRPLDAIGGFRHPERAAVGDAARRLVGVDAVDREMRDREIVGAGDDVHEARRPFRRIGAGVEGAVVGQHMHAQAGDLAVLGRRDLRRHVIVAGEGGGGEVLHPVLDPFHRLAGDDGRDGRADIAGIGADLVAEAAADVGRDDVDLVLRTSWRSATRRCG
jgi:Arc/MetJ family transcription regulator